MLIPDDKPATIQTAEHDRQYRQQLARKGVKETHVISTKNNIKGIKLHLAKGWQDITLSCPSYK